MFKINSLFTTLLIIFVANTAITASNLFTIESIKDSSEFLKKVKQPENPLYKYFEKNKAAVSRADIVEVINMTILPSTNFAYEATQLGELQTNDKFEELSSGKKEEVIQKNRMLLAELYPDAITYPEYNSSMKQGFIIKLNNKQLDNTAWLKAEVVNFLNEIVCNSNVLNSWENLRTFFDPRIRDEEVENFVVSMKGSDISSLPINSIYIQAKNDSQLFNIVIKDKKNKSITNVFTIELITKKTWKIVALRNISKILKDAGFTTKNTEVRNE